MAGVVTQFTVNVGANQKGKSAANSEKRNNLIIGIF